MERIGIISDTHDVLRSDAVEILRTCDYILHAGDVTTERILGQLRLLGNIYAVCGNNDWSLQGQLRKTLRFEIGGVRFFMTHDRRDVARQLKGTDVVIFGHSHKYFQEMVDGRLWLNPGSCGRPRFGMELTMAVMEVSNGRYQTEKILLKS